MLVICRVSRLNFGDLNSELEVGGVTILPLDSRQIATSGHKPVK
jgi:hypothetical protein